MSLLGACGHPVSVEVLSLVPCAISWRTEGKKRPEEIHI